MVKKTKTPKKVYKYVNGIYSIPLYVTKETNTRRLSKLFKVWDYSNDKWCSLTDDDLDGAKAATARAITVVDKKPCILVILVKPITISTIAHEAYHIVEAYSEQFDLNNSNGYTNEAKAYLTGYIAECIYNSK